ncbi:type I glutamate--ammonia ligase [Chiayiivirga flava]|uniref:Glutamine synthetase n=1 Tax=Chiayiivirga flava TaxID=659595 RepID=A0A7W8D681_9GAMM|nr:type I glutamate--ammonia ligase [Chiayiivirga flava]MBB5207540.1 glutamine synthetase [Chiayiivirga flava]
MSYESVQKLIKDNNVEFVDLRFADILGKQHHVTFPIRVVDETLFEEGKMFDGSSIAGWKGINESDMVLLPDPDTAVLDPFTADPTLILICDVLEPATMQAYSRCPRSVAKRAEAYVKSSGAADLAFFGPEPEFFIFDSVRYGNDMGHTFFEIDSEEAHWNSAKAYEGGNSGYRPGIKGGYFPVAPADTLHDVRAEMVKAIEAAGIEVEVHHHEVANAGQCEIGTKFNTLVKKADELLTMKYIIKNVAHRNGKTATFMPKPLVGDNGSGMHVHQSLSKGGQNLFAGEGYGGLSQLALWYIGGIFKHARAINAFTNSTTNSYKRLVPGFEAPVMLAYSARNRSASCRIPWVSNPKARRIEIRFPDPMNTGYLAFTALLMAGLDGIKNKIDPGAPSDKDLYDLPPEEEKNIPTVCHSLDQALDALDKDRDFLKAGGVFSDDFIDGYIALKMQEVTKFRAATHPLEYAMYYAL